MGHGWLEWLLCYDARSPTRDKYDPLPFRHIWRLLANILRSMQTRAIVLGGAMLDRRLEQNNPVYLVKRAGSGLPSPPSNLIPPHICDPPAASNLSTFRLQRTLSILTLSNRAPSILLSLLRSSALYRSIVVGQDEVSSFRG